MDRTPLRVGYLGVGGHVPPRELTNSDLERFVDTSDEWIRQRTGVRSRRVLDGRESILGMAAKASRLALERAGVAASDLDDIRVAVNTWMRIPSLATALQEEIGAIGASASDVSAGCAGFVYAVEGAWHRMLAEHRLYGRRTRALVVGVDALSHITDWTDRSTCVLLGDGAGAVVLGEVEAGGILATHTSADGRHRGLLYSEAPNSHKPPPDGAPSLEGAAPQQFLRMDGRRVFVAAVETMVADAMRVVEKYRLASGRALAIDDIDYLYPHQANLRIIEGVARRLRLPLDRVYQDGIAQFGNTSAASIPLGYEDTRNRIAPGEGPWIEMDVAFGAGFASGAILRERARAV